MTAPVPGVRDNGAVSAIEPDAAEPDQPIVVAGETSDIRVSDGVSEARPRRVSLFVLIAVVVVILDTVSKAIVVAELGNRAPVRLLGGALYLLETRNAGAAFSVGTGATIVLTLVALVVIAVIMRAARRMRSIGWAIALGLILGGALGNLSDRLFRAPGFGRGHVVDWISLFADDGHIWPVFNLADSAIVGGAVLAALLGLRGVEFTGTRSVQP